MTALPRDLGAAALVRLGLAAVLAVTLLALPATAMAQDTDTATTPSLTNHADAEIDTSAYETQAEFDKLKAAEDATKATEAQKAAETAESAGAVVTGEGAAVPTVEPTTTQRVQKYIDEAFAYVNNEFLEPVLFFDISFRKITNPSTNEPVSVPLIVAVLLLGGMFFTFRYGLVNIRLFAHGLQVLRGKYDNPGDHGEVTHFQALSAALAATVGLGNIAGVALAISGGGPGAVFWMWVVAVFGMSSKFSSCTLAQLYRKVTTDETGKGRDHILGGPMVYLSEGMKDVFGKTFGTPFGKLLAISFAFFTIMGAIGGGNMFQANQTFEIVSFVALDGDKEYAWVAGVIMAILVGLVMVGGMRRIGEVTSKLVSGMCLLYCGVCLVILLANVGQLPRLLGLIFVEAFNVQALGWGGVVGIMVTGITRGAFSNEAGLGSAAIAHSATKTSEPVREGTVAMMGPFIDTIIVCTMTALVILVSQDQIAPDVMARIDAISTGTDVRGAALTGAAFGTLHGYLPFLLCIAVFVFAYSTMIGWGYYGERASEYLFGKGGIWPFRILFLGCVVIGPMVSLLNVKNFTELLILSMAYPNILGMLFLSGKVARASKDYIRRLKSGEIKTYAEMRKAAEGEPSI